mmetsp:Transcript_16386/g.37932  ORF Transcript_16386/g.37932 Transcript_16386/m.37932 type:complete len:457 (-) Transcript_16386:23-1393(-)
MQLTKQLDLVTVAVTSLLQQSKVRVPNLAARSSGRELEAERVSRNAGLLSALLGGGSPEEDEMFGLMEDAADDCGIDIMEMVGKLMTMSMFEMDDIADYTGMLKALKDDDEDACGPEDEAKITIAHDSFLQCSGMADLVAMDNPFVTNNDCRDWMSLGTSLATELDELEMQGVDLSDLETALELPGADLSDIIGDLPQGMAEELSNMMNSAHTCMVTLLGDNPVGNFVRLQYQNIDTTLQCFHGLSQELPKCVLSEPGSDGDEGIDLPLSLEKKMACVLSEEILYKPLLESMCIELHAGLDACLPPLDQQQNTRQYEKVQECANERSLLLGEIPDMGIAATAITGESIYPSFCTRVAPSLDFSSLDDRITHYNGWVVNEISGNSPEIAAAFGSEQERPASSSESAPSASGMSPTAIGALVLGGLLVMAAIVSQKRAANVSYAQPHDLRRVEMDDLA